MKNTDNNPQDNVKEVVRQAITLLMSIADGDFVSKKEALEAGRDLHNIAVSIVEPQDNVPQSVKSAYALDKLKMYAKIKREILSDKSWGNADDRTLKLSEIESLEHAIVLIEKSDHEQYRIAELEARNKELREALERIQELPPNSTLYQAKIIAMLKKSKAEQALNPKQDG